MINWIKNLFKKKENKSGMKVIQRGGNTYMYDKMSVEYMESKLPNPTQSRLAEVIDSAVKLIISKREVNKETNKFFLKPIVEITDKSELEIAKSNLEIRDETPGHLMSFGSFIFDFITETGEVHQIELLGFGAIRFHKMWKDDAYLKNPRQLLEWLAAVGVHEPLEQLNEEIKKNEERQKNFQEWKMKAPKTLLDHFDTIQRDPVGIDNGNLYQELKNEITNETELILKLFKLYAHNSDQWNVMLLHESLPSYVLMGIDIETLNKAFKSQNLSPEHKEGISRFLSSWDFMTKREADLEKIEDEFKSMLLLHLESIGNEDKINLFKRTLINETEIGIEEVLGSHKFELEISKNGNAIIQQKTKPRNIVLERIIIYSLTIGLILFLFFIGRDRAVFIGIILIIWEISNFSKNKIKLKGDKLIISKQGITIEDKKRNIEIQKKEIEKFTTKLDNEEDQKSYGAIIVQKKDGEEIELLKVFEDNFEFIENDLKIILNFVTKKLEFSSDS